MDQAAVVVAVIALLILGGFIPAVLCQIFTLIITYRQRSLRDQLTNATNTLRTSKIVGFFHPYCNAGGGGERVLWTAIAHIQTTQPEVVCVVYSGDIDATKDEILRKAQDRMGIALDTSKIHFVFLQGRKWVEDSTWPRFTLLGQSIGSMILAAEAFTTLLPDLYIDTMGYAFTFPVLAVLSSLARKAVPMGAYVHYPTISTTMLERVENRTAGVTNSSTVASSSILSRGKLIYYTIFMHTYSLSLHFASFLMTNSSWTDAHVRSVLAYEAPLWISIPTSLVFYVSPSLCIIRYFVNKRYAGQAGLYPEHLHTKVVFPPCDTSAMASFPLDGREPTILSIAQFRPEKDHATQLHALSLLFAQHPELERSGVKLVLVGGARNEGDRARVESLKTLAVGLSISHATEFRVNAPYPDMLNLLSRSSVGIHTMVDEHFGISVVELLAAGVIPVAHASAGPLLDIVVPVNGQRTGFLATTAQEFADGMYMALTLDEGVAKRMRETGRRHAVGRFNEGEFNRSWDESGWKEWL